MHLARLALRGVVGPLMVGHGTQKLFGWFGGHGLEATGNAFESMGLRPGKRHATAAGVAETAGGALLTLGALTPVAAATITGVMITAIRKVHGAKGPWVTGGGYEYNLVMIAAVTTLADDGPGRPSVDAAFAPWLRGRSFAIASLVAAAAGSWLATERFTEPEPQVERRPRFEREPAEVPAAAT
jgi:putative oxidoreductase